MKLIMEHFDRNPGIFTIRILNPIQHALGEAMHYTLVDCYHIDLGDNWEWGDHENECNASQWISQRGGAAKFNPITCPFWQISGDDTLCNMWGKRMFGNKKDGQEYICRFHHKHNPARKID